VRSLVLGANGFLGAALVDHLSSLGHDVTAFDRYGAGTVRFSSNPRILRGDLLNEADLARAVDGQDLVFHFVSTTTPATVELEPRVDIRTNVSATLDLLDASVAAGVKRFYFASSGGAVYGDQGLQSYRETDVTMPISPYAIGKLTIEHYLRYYEIEHGLRSVVLRLSNPYGPGQDPNRRQGFIPIALGRVRERRPVVVLGEGTMIRDYTYISDVIGMIGRLAEAVPQHRVYNLGSGTGYSILEVLDVIRTVTGSELDIEHAPSPRTFVEHVVLDTARYRAEFGEPELTSLEQGIAATWATLPPTPGVFS
jgi:UDP-glucose 4-epimerase